MRTQKALVVGATGVIGRSLLQELSADPEWEVVAVSRRKPDLPGEYGHLSVNLDDREETLKALGGLHNLTHVFYSAYVQKQNPTELVEANLTMLTNVIDAVEPAATKLKHVNLVQGAKWYGSHLGPFKTPAQETDPRHMPPNFYYDQQDFLAARQRGKDWVWSAIRPHTICGFSTNSPMNLVMVIAAYATISKALGLPFRHPGSEANANALYNVTDSSLAARSCIWASTSDTAANDAFNITNGDIFRWRDMWPIIADYFELDLARPQKIDLVQMMGDKGPLWAELSDQYGLQSIPFADLVNWSFGNHVFTPEYDIILSTTKIRKSGFYEVQDTAEMFVRQFDRLRKQKIIP